MFVYSGNSMRSDMSVLVLCFMRMEVMMPIHVRVDEYCGVL